MRIAMVSRMVHREGGIQACVWELAKRFAQWNHEVHLYTNLCPESPHPSVIIRHVPMLMSRSFRKAQNPWVKVFQIWSYSWISRFALRGQDYDIVHVQGDSLAKADVRTANSCHKAWIKYDLTWDRSLGNRLRKRFNPLHAILLLIDYYDYTISGARRVISVSGAVKQQTLDNYPVDESRIAVIPTGVEYDRFSVPSEFDAHQFRRQLGIPEGKPIMVFVGWEFKRKGLATVLDAMPLMTSVSPHLLVVGGDQQPSFIRQAERLGIKDKVHFVGAQSDVRPFLWGSDIFVFPTRYEPSGIVIMEAMAAGLPVVVSRCAGASEWVREDVEAALLDDPFDVEELARKLEGMLCDPQKMSLMGEAARKKAREFDWDRIAELTLQVYQSVVDSKDNGSR
jgi:UDP-glucose:(heptosyl)LPS alpha-1,3-glucosyltransferase